MILFCSVLYKEILTRKMADIEVNELDNPNGILSYSSVHINYNPNQDQCCG